MRPVTSLVILTCILWLSLLTSCAERSSTITGVRNTNFSAEETFSATIDRTSQTTVGVEGINGSIEVTGVSGTAVIVVSAVRRVESDTPEDAASHLDELQVVVDSSSTEIIVRTEHPLGSQGRNYTVHYTVTVPNDMLVDLVNTNGDVIVHSLLGDAAIHVTNGRIQADALAGNANFVIVNGQIDMSATLASGGAIDLSTTNGAINLLIPQNTGAEVSAMWANGGASLFNLTLTNENRTTNSLTGTLGNGDGTITLAVVNGTIVITGT